MKYYHVTLERNLKSILVLGLDPNFSRGKLKGTFVVTKTSLWWAVAHIMARHKASYEEIIVIGVDVPRRWRLNGKIVKVGYRGSKGGCWRVKEGIGPCRFFVLGDILEGGIIQWETIE